MNEELTLEQAEKIVDDMYQKRWEECGVEDGNTIHLGNLNNLQYNDLEKASILLLRVETRLKRENKQLQQENKQLKELLDQLENWLRQEIDSPFSKYFENDEYIRIVNKIRELKGEKNINVK